MHSYASRCSIASNMLLMMLSEKLDEIHSEMQNIAPTRCILAIRSVSLIMATHAIGMLAGFEAELQRLGFENFSKVKSFLEGAGLPDVADRLQVFKDAVNVLKHGEGSSYKRLLERDTLPFQMKREDQAFFNEGDVAEIDTLIQVDEKFVSDCVTLIIEIQDAIKHTP